MTRGDFRANIHLGFNPVGAKSREGDGRTPEGEYFISTKSASAKYLLSLGLSYPNPSDARRALDAGIIDIGDYERIAVNPARPPWDTGLGGYIMIHGFPASGAPDGDWTAGCIALENRDMRALYDICALGDRVMIYP